MAKIEVKGSEITIVQNDKREFISLTDIAKYKNKTRPDDLIRNRIRNRNTIEYLGIWEQLYNPNFKPVEFDGIKKEAGLNSFSLTLQIEGLNTE